MYFLYYWVLVSYLFLHKAVHYYLEKFFSSDKGVIDFATVYLKGTQYGCTTNEKGLYHLKAPAGNTH